MAEYQRVEYTIDKNGNIVERVLNATGSSCVDLTAELEEALGVVESKKLLPEYYAQHQEEEITGQQTNWAG